MRKFSEEHLKKLSAAHKEYWTPEMRAAASERGRRIKLPEKEVIELYAAGDSFRDLAERYSVSAWTVRQVLVRHNVQSRERLDWPRKKGPENHRWKSEGACYTSLHHRVWRQRGKPQHCEDCGTTDPSKRYEWANLTGNYADVNDYKRMCRSCHAKYDYSTGVRIPRGQGKHEVGIYYRMLLPKS